MTTSPNQTSARYLLSVIENHGDPAKTEMAFDVFIKARSYVILNKVSFLFSIAGSVLVILWPVIAAMAKGTGSILSDAIAQTAVTAFTGLAIYFYSHYKKKQMVTETLLRLIAFSDTPLPELSKTIVNEMQRIDIGIQLTRQQLDNKTG